MVMTRRPTVGGELMRIAGRLMARAVVDPAPEQGPPGEEGPSAYEIAVAAGFVGSQAAWLASLKVTGDPGVNAWTPKLRGAADGTRTLIEVYDWTGGGGTKPAAGYLTSAGTLASAKADGFNFNAAKRVVVVSGQTNGSGVATLDFTSLGLAAAPNVVALPATTAVLSGPTRSTVSSVTKSGCTVTVQQQAILTGVLSLLAGATANVLVIEN